MGTGVYFYLLDAHVPLALDLVQAVLPVVGVEVPEARGHAAGEVADSCNTP